MTLTQPSDFKSSVRYPFSTWSLAAAHLDLKPAKSMDTSMEKTHQHGNLQPTVSTICFNDYILISVCYPKMCSSFLGSDVWWCLPKVGIFHYKVGVETSTKFKATRGFSIGWRPQAVGKSVDSSMIFTHQSQKKGRFFRPLRSMCFASW